MAEQYWVRVVGFLQPPPAREVFRPSGYYRGTPQHAPAAQGRGDGAVATAPAVAPPRPDLTIGDGDRLIYLALGQFVLYAVGTVTDGPAPDPADPAKQVCSVKTDVFINAVLKAPHFGGQLLPSGRDLRLVVQQYTYIWLSPEDGEALIARVHNKAGAKD